MNKVIILLAILLFGLNACKPKKSLIEPPKVSGFPIDSTGEALTAEKLMSPVLKDWTYFSSKIEIEYAQNSQNIKATAHVRMYRDSLIWITAGMFGMEGFRILINEDSVIVLDRLKKSYQIRKVSDLGNIGDSALSITQIQNLIIARPAYALNLYKLTFLPDSNVNLDYTQEKFSTSHTIKKSDLTIDSTRIDDRLTKNYASALYQSYTVVDGHNIPLKNTLTATNGNSIVSIKLDLSEVDFTTELTYPCTIPASYEKAK